MFVMGASSDLGLGWEAERMILITGSNESWEYVLAKQLLGKQGGGGV